MRKSSEKERFNKEKAFKITYDHNSIILNKETTIRIDSSKKKHENKQIVVPKYQINKEYYSGQRATIIIPKHYITYKEIDRNYRKESLDRYELTIHDYHYLKIFPEMNENELIEIISLLENNIIDPSTGSFISLKKAREIISSFYLMDPRIIDNIYKYWNSRIEDYGKPLLRKNWKKYNIRDKFIKNTFIKSTQRQRSSRMKFTNIKGKLLEIRDQLITLKAIVDMNLCKENHKRILLEMEIVLHHFEKDIIDSEMEENKESLMEITNIDQNRSLRTKIHSKGFSNYQENKENL